MSHYFTDDKAAELHALIERAERCGFRNTPMAASALWMKAAILEAELREFLWQLNRRPADWLHVDAELAEVGNSGMRRPHASGPTAIHAIVSALEQNHAT